MSRLKNLSLWLLLLVVLFDWMGVGLVYPMFSAMLFKPDCSFLSCDASNAERGFYLGVLLASMSIAQFFSGPVLGALSDQMGRRPILLYTLILGVIGYLCCMGAVWVESFGALVFSRLLVGIGAGKPVSAAIADISKQESKAKNFGLYSMACGVGFTIGPFLGGKFSGNGYYLPFLIAALASLVNLLFIFVFYRETNKFLKAQTLQFSAGIKNLKKAFTIPGLRIVFLASFLYCFGWSFYYEFLPVTWISDFQFDVEQIGFFYAYGAGWYALSSGCLIRPFVNRFRSETIFFFALMAIGFLLLSMFFGRTILWIWIGFPIANFLASMLFPTSTAMASNWAGKDAQGETLGILQSVQSAAFAFSPLAAGAFLGESPHMPMILGGISMLLSALVVGVTLRSKVFSTKPVNL